MIKAVKLGHEVVVTRGVYEDLYKPLGYAIKSENKVNKVKPVKNDVENEETEAKDIKEKVDEEEVKPSFKRK